MALNVWINGKCPSATPSLGSFVALFVVMILFGETWGLQAAWLLRIYRFVTGKTNEMLWIALRQ